MINTSPIGLHGEAAPDWLNEPFKRITQRLHMFRFGLSQR